MPSLLLASTNKTRVDTRPYVAKQSPLLFICLAPAPSDVWTSLPLFVFHFISYEVSRLRFSFSTKLLFSQQKLSKDWEGYGRIHRKEYKWDGDIQMMKAFNHLVSEQMQTMEKLLYLQSELERCEEIEEELKMLQQETELESIQIEIASMKKELKEIHQIFENQTEEVIRSYQEVKVMV